MTDETQAPRTDGWATLSGSLGSIRDKSVGTTFVERDRLDDAVIRGLYKQNALVAKIVDRMVDDGLRRGWTLTDVHDADGNPVDIDQGKLHSLCDDLRVTRALRRAGKWSRRDGGALIVLPVIDGMPTDQPLQVTSHTPLRPLNVIPARRAQPLAQDVGIMSSTYGKVLEYQISTSHGEPIKLHHSRCIPMSAIDIPIEDLEEDNRNGWGPSIIERIFDDLGRDGAAISHAVSMLYISSVLYLKMTGYRQDANSDAGKLKIRKGLAEVRQNLDSHGFLAMDQADEIGNLTLTTAGAFEIVDRCAARLAAVGEMPKEILMNESPAGLNAGELSGPQEIWFARVEQWQDDQATPVLDRILELIFAWQGWPITSWTVVWNPLHSKSEETAAMTAKTNAESDQIYMLNGCVTADEVRKARFVDGNQGAFEVEPEADPADLPINPGEVEAQVAAEAPAAAPVEALSVAEEALSVAEEAMNGAQISGISETLSKMNAGELTPEQAAWLIGLAVPRIKGQPIPPPPVNAAPAPAGGPEVDEAQPSAAPVPADVVSVQAAAKQLGVPTRTLTLAMERGTLPFWGFGARKTVSLADVLKLGKSHEAPEDDDAGTDR